MASFAAILLVFAASAAVLLVISLQRTDGHLVYPLDDTYIHMAIAKNVVRHGVFGLSPTTPSAASSSPLWTFLLVASYRLTGINEVAPLVLNLVSAAMALWMCFTVLRSRWPSAGARIVCVLIAALAVPLPTMVLTGMEHTLHAACVLALAWTAAGILEAPPGARSFTRGFLLSGLVFTGVLVRYETLFVVAVVVLLLLLRKRFVAALLVCAATAVPLAVYGRFSAACGGYGLPNPVILKGAMPSFETASSAARAMGYQSVDTILRREPLLYLLLAGALGLFAWLAAARRRWDRRTVLLVVFLGALLLHGQFAQIGWLFRYQGYLVFLGATAVLLAGAEPARTFRGWWRERAGGTARTAAVCLAVILLAPVGWRTAMALHTTPAAARNISQQQYQVGRFIKAFFFFDERRVAVQDTGTVSFLSDAHGIDLWGGRLIAGPSGDPFRTVSIVG